MPTFGKAMCSLHSTLYVLLYYLLSIVIRVVCLDRHGVGCDSGVERRRREGAIHREELCDALLALLEDCRVVRPLARHSGEMLHVPL